MKRIVYISFLLSTFFLTAQIETEIKGIAKVSDIDTLVLTKTYQDWRYHGIEIPVKKEKVFQYFLKHSFIEEYSIVLKSDLKKGKWRPVIFFPSGTTIQFELHPLIQYSKNKIIGDSLGKRKIQYQADFGKKFSKKGNEIYGALFQSKKNSEAYKKAKYRLDSLNRESLLFLQKYFENDPSILGLNEYVYLLKNANQMMISKEILRDYQTFYLRKEFDHPLIERAIHLYANLSNEIKVGGPFAEITLTDVDRNSLKLSELVKSNDYLILDLWSPWCGPCIRKSKILKENYSRIKQKSHIVGVVGGINKMKKAISAMNRFDYPWKNYLEISDKNQIWESYGIANSGGAQFLINKKGTILAINPSLEEINRIINRK